MSKDKMTYSSKSPLLAEMRKKPLKEVTYNDYGVRKLKQRIRDKPKFTLNTRH